MAGIIGQNISQTSFSITLSDGRVFTKTKQDIQTLAGQQTGNAAARKTATINALKAELQTFLGDEYDANQFIIDFLADGTPSVWTCRNISIP